jgi:DNA mismatch repair ATPase MutS
MDSLKALIERHRHDFPDFQYYGSFAEFIKAIEIYHQELDSHTGVTADCCNSLIQSLCRTIITQMTSETAASLKKDRTDQLVKKAAKLLQQNDDIYERNLISQLEQIGKHINDLRNARGEISHGRAIPKELIHDKELPRLLREITESLARYLLSSFFCSRIEEPTEEAKKEKSCIQYDKNPEFNDYLDQLYPYEGKLLYSQGLYTLYYEDYDIKLQEFLDEQKLLEESD